ncbi:hypothetical protein [Niabella hirudinis]|uniref:hypothetical protein n=1 Tax=Niabella hirudinis TaxID=1285929 RepID=UPI003EBDDB4D
MKHKIMFFLPRLAGLALLVGLASLVLFLLFRLLLLVVAIGTIVAITAKLLSGARKKWMQGYPPEHGLHPHFRNPGHSNPAMPIATQVNAAIVPIN